MAKDLKTAVFCFGRFNPPTIGHGKLLDALISVAKRKGGRNSDTFILASHSVDSEKNPLTKDQKAFYLKKMFPKQMKHYDLDDIELNNLKYMKPWAAFNLIGRPKAVRAPSLERNLLKFAQKRMMKIEDLYGMLELLTSKRSEYINGSSIVMDGGYSAW